MGEIEKLLEDFKGEGVEDSSGHFTIDFQKAREKLAKFQLTDPHELILKLVQAGNLASSGIGAGIQRGELVVKYRNWDPELTLERLADRLAAATLSTGDDALGHLCVGLSAMLGLGTTVKLEQKLPDQNFAKSLLLGTELTWEEHEEPLQDARFVISTKLSDKLDRAKLHELLSQRCMFCPVPVLWEGKMIEPMVPQPSGQHRPPFFRENKVLARHRYSAGAWTTPLLPSLGDLREGQRMAHLSLTVDLDPKATIWFCKAGVMAEQKRLDLGVPGMIGVVVADDLPTDLTGSQFLEGEALTGVENWLRKSGQALLGDAIVATRGVISESQPVASTAPIRTRFFGVGCLTALVGWIGGVTVIANTPHSSAWIMPNTFFWVFFPGLWVWVAVQRHGCEKDDKSDQAAKFHLLQILQKFKRY